MSSTTLDRLPSRTAGRTQERVQAPAPSTTSRPSRLSRVAAWADVQRFADRIR
jgi:hypothetical protein